MQRPGSALSHGASLRSLSFALAKPCPAPSVPQIRTLTADTFRRFVRDVAPSRSQAACPCRGACRASPRLPDPGLRAKVPPSAAPLSDR